jgi:hypothetical protein
VANTWVILQTRFDSENYTRSRTEREPNSLLTGKTTGKIERLVAFRDGKIEKIAFGAIISARLRPNQRGRSNAANREKSFAKQGIAGAGGPPGRLT